ncbi:MAG: twin-arginine translocase TatA/TatE family subunit [Opitutales bacterium]|nr:twin-arginine translocase TatA/TatE family subunit [Opitutales bacterium]MBQ2722489.1 twin-arginine translocase TatA/TatE family subunit [Opitutales bacterium]MBR7106730.1 twin-arginine translocase TatA/TatE family subunit [Opitutales bacterium]
MPGGTEWIVILLAILLLFGAKRLPELAKGLGKSIREFKKATSEVEDNIREAIKEEEVKKVQATKTEPVETEASAKDKVE